MVPEDWLGSNIEEVAVAVPELTEISLPPFADVFPQMIELSNSIRSLFAENRMLIPPRSPA
jgi:hypothetical protein